MKDNVTSVLPMQRGILALQKPSLHLTWLAPDSVNPGSQRNSPLNSRPSALASASTTPFSGSVT